MNKVEVSYAPPLYYFDMNNKEDAEFIKLLQKKFTVICNPTIKFNDIKPYNKPYNIIKDEK